MTDATASAAHDMPPVFALPGRVLTVAADRRLLEICVVDGSRPDGAFTATAPRLMVREGLPVECRVFDEGCVWRLGYVVVRATQLAEGTAGITLELAVAERVGEERTSPRVAYKSLATMRSVYYGPYEIGAFRVHTVELSATSIAFECDRRFDSGQQYDLAVDDDTGQRIYARVEIARLEAGHFGRTRAFARFIALDTPDRTLLEQLISRQLLRAEVELDVVVVPTATALREQLMPDREGRLARLFRKAG